MRRLSIRPLIVGVIVAFCAVVSFAPSGHSVRNVILSAVLCAAAAVAFLLSWAFPRWGLDRAARRARQSVVRLSGRLVCATEEEAARVRRHLPEHVERTRAEDGCISFDVDPTEDPLIWSVEERFVDRGAFESHQRRVASSVWGRATAGIARQYTIEGFTR